MKALRDVGLAQVLLLPAAPEASATQP
jgi:hypothetical protein